MGSKMGTTNNPLHCAEDFPVMIWAIKSFSLRHFHLSFPQVRSLPMNPLREGNILNGNSIHLSATRGAKGDHFSRSPPKETSPTDLRTLLLGK